MKLQAAALALALMLASTLGACGASSLTQTRTGAETGDRLIQGVAPSPDAPFAHARLAGLDLSPEQRERLRALRHGAGDRQVRSGMPQLRARLGALLAAPELDRAALRSLLEEGRKSWNARKEARQAMHRNLEEVLTPAQREKLKARLEAARSGKKAGDGPLARMAGRLELTESQRAEARAILADLAANPTADLPEATVDRAAAWLASLSPDQRARLAKAGKQGRNGRRVRSDV
ncbi:MAG: Spy/CpxP family protein refolding chaperone [bacterium]|nr:Spy/CpxP family protein refolding chaperone [bacterium]